MTYKIVIVVLLTLCSCQSKSPSPDNPQNAATATIPKNDSSLACKLSSEQMAQREETVIAHLKTHIIGKKELSNGYAFKFPGSDTMIDELVDFIKTERECCSFFTFNLAVSGDTNAVWLELSGPENTKEIIHSVFE